MRASGEERHGADTAGQADLRSATRDWAIDHSAIAPMSGQLAGAMTPPFSAPTWWSPPATDHVLRDGDGRRQLKNVEVSFRNSSTRENLGDDCNWGVGVNGGSTASRPPTSAATYNWSYTTPFNLKPGRTTSQCAPRTTRTSRRRQPTRAA